MASGAETGVVVATTGALPAPGMCSVVPEITQPSAFSPLAAANAEGETPWRAAIPLSVSPGWTRYPPPPPPDAAGAALTGGVGAWPGAGVVRLVPATTRASGERPFAVATALVGRLLAIAMPQSVSPGATVCTAAEEIAGLMTNITSAAGSERASMRVAYHCAHTLDAYYAVFREP